MRPASSPPTRTWSVVPMLVSKEVEENVRKIILKNTHVLNAHFKEISGLQNFPSYYRTTLHL